MGPKSWAAAATERRREGQALQSASPLLQLRPQLGASWPGLCHTSMRDLAERQPRESLMMARVCCAYPAPCGGALPCVHSPPPAQRAPGGLAPHFPGARPWGSPFPRREALGLPASQARGPGAPCFPGARPTASHSERPAAGGRRCDCW